MGRERRNLYQFPLVVVVTFYVTFIFNSLVNSSPVTNPLTSDGDIGKIIPAHIDSKKAKAYHTFSPIDVAHLQFNEINMDIEESCNIDMSLSWMTNIGQPVYSPPVIYPISTSPSAPSDPNHPMSREGLQKNIFIASYFNNIEVLNSDGSRPAGWPISFESSSFQARPIVYDIDNDGVQDVGIVDQEANLYWIRLGEQGTYLSDYHIQLPKLRLKRNWIELVQEQDKTGQDLTAELYIGLSRFEKAKDKAREKLAKGENPLDNQHVSDPWASPDSKHFVNRTATAKLDPLSSANSGDVTASSNSNGRRQLLAEEVDFGQEKGEAFEEEDLSQRMEEAFNVDSRFREDPYANEEGGDSPSISDMSRFYGYGSNVNTVRNGDDALFYYMSRRYGDMSEEADDHTYVSVDAHVLATPAVADINKDGHLEIIFPVSYFFEKSAYHNRKDLDFDPTLYVASGLVCWDMSQQEWSWTQHLDLTTARSKFPAVIYSAPTVADLDGDDRLEVVVGTSVGLLYVLDAQSGFLRRFFPMQLHSIVAQVAVADVLGGADLEIIVGDMAGNLLVISPQGEVIWDRILSGACPITPTIADIDGDGQVDIIIPTVDDKTKKSHIWALRGSDGELLSGFPIALPKQATVSAPIIIAQLDILGEEDDPVKKLSKEDLAYYLDIHDNIVIAPKKPTGKAPVNSNKSKQSQQRRRPHMIVSSYEGFVYLMAVQERPSMLANNKATANNASATGEEKKTEELSLCVSRVDIGSHIATPALLDDLTGDGYLDLLVGSLSGDIYVYQTSSIYHPSNTWNTFPRFNGHSFSYADLSIAWSPYESTSSISSNMMSIFQYIFGGSSSSSNHNAAGEVPTSAISAESRDEYNARGRYMVRESWQYRTGENMTLVFEIADHKSNANATTTNPDGSSNNIGGGLNGEKEVYRVRVVKGANRDEPIYQGEYEKIGKYAIHIPISGAEKNIYQIIVETNYGRYSEDFIEIHISTKFYIWLKYFILLPVLVFCMIIYIKLVKLPEGLVD